MSSRTKVSELFSREEIRMLSATSDLAGWRAVGFNWAVIALTFAALAYWPHPAMFVLAVLILGGRQLAFAIMMHDASHYTLFKTRALNDFAGDWLAGRFIWIDVKRYRIHHNAHHTKTGTEQDPDRSLVTPFPTSRGSLVRKLLRDITGLSVFRRIAGLFLMDIGVVKWTVASEAIYLPRNGRRIRDYLWDGVRNLTPVILVNAALAGVLAAAGHLWLYSAWVVAYCTSFGLYVRIRSMAEHAGLEQTTNMLRNTRTTRAGFLARATVAPLQVNYHIEHHLLPAIPYFRLKAAHRLLRERGQVAEAPGYVDVLRMMVRPSR